VGPVEVTDGCGRLGCRPRPGLPGLPRCGAAARRWGLATSAPGDHEPSQTAAGLAGYHLAFGTAAGLASAALMAAAIGIPHASWREQVHAVVTLVEGAQVDEQELIAHVREQITVAARRLADAHRAVAGNRSEPVADPPDAAAAAGGPRPGCCRRSCRSTSTGCCTCSPRTSARSSCCGSPSGSPPTRPRPASAVRRVLCASPSTARSTGCGSTCVPNPASACVSDGVHQPPRRPAPRRPRSSSLTAATRSCRPPSAVPPATDAGT
jgi:hypothetical protein